MATSDIPASTVAEEPSGAPQATPEGTTGAQADDLDTLLSSIDKEYAQASAPKPAEPPKPTEGQSDPRFDELQRTVQAIEQERVASDIEAAVRTVQEHLGDGLPVKLPDRVVRGMLNDLAMENRGVMVAFQNRRQEPGTWKRILAASAAQLRKEFGDPVDQQLTSDRAAAQAAVRGASKASATDDGQPNLAAMSDQEFLKWKREHG